MKITPQGRNWRTNAQRGRYYVRVFRGVTVVSSWPKKRGAPRTERERLAQAKFAEANLMTKYVDPAEIAYVNEITAGTMYMPRDLLISQMYGRFWRLGLVDGTVLYPMATVYDITALLDALGQQPGQLLYRGTEFWRALPPGQPGRLLATDGTNLLWSTPSQLGIGGGGFYGFAALANPSANTGNYNTVGRVVIPRETCTISAILAILDHGTGSRVYRAQIARLDGTSPAAEIQDILATSDPFEEPTVLYQSRRLPFPEPVVLLAGVPYIIALFRPNEPSTARTNLLQGTTATGIALPAGPFDVLDEQWRYNSVGLALGAAPAETAAQPAMIALEGVIGAPEA